MGSKGVYHNLGVITRVDQRTHSLPYLSLEILLHYNRGTILRQCDCFFRMGPFNFRSSTAGKRALRDKNCRYCSRGYCPFVSGMKGATRREVARIHADFKKV